jgi:hypothetical protein
MAAQTVELSVNPSDETAILFGPLASASSSLATSPTRQRGGV